MQHMQLSNPVCHQLKKLHFIPNLEGSLTAMALGQSVYALKSELSTLCMCLWVKDLLFKYMYSIFFYEYCQHKQVTDRSRGLLASPENFPSFCLLVVNWVLMPFLTHSEVRYPHGESEAVFIDTHTKEKAALLFHVLSVKLGLGFPVMPTCMPVFWTPPIGSYLPPPVGEA